MNIQYENEEDNSLIGSFRSDPNPHSIQMGEK